MMLDLYLKQHLHLLVHWSMSQRFYFTSSFIITVTFYFVRASDIHYFVQLHFICLSLSYLWWPLLFGLYKFMALCIICSSLCCICYSQLRFRYNSISLLILHHFIHSLNLMHDFIQLCIQFSQRSYSRAFTFSYLMLHILFIFTLNCIISLSL